MSQTAMAAISRYARQRQTGIEVLCTLIPVGCCRTQRQLWPRKVVIYDLKLLTKALRKQLPPLYATEGEADPLVICKFFTPDAGWTWYAIEFDGDDTFYGFVDGLFPELGYFSLSELLSIRGKLGLPIERDCYFRPCHLSEIQKSVGL